MITCRLKQDTVIFLRVVGSRTGPDIETLLLVQLWLKEGSEPGLSRGQDQDPIVENVFVVQRFTPAQGYGTSTTATEIFRA